jgi:hypothetical protein
VQGADEDVDVEVPLGGVRRASTDLDAGDLPAMMLQIAQERPVTTSDVEDSPAGLIRRKPHGHSVKRFIANRSADQWPETPVPTCRSHYGISELHQCQVPHIIAELLERSSGKDCPDRNARPLVAVILFVGIVIADPFQERAGGKSDKLTATTLDDPELAGQPVKPVFRVEELGRRASAAQRAAHDLLHVRFTLPPISSTGRGRDRDRRS